MPIHHLEGPLTSKVSRTQAEEKLRNRTDLLPRGTEYELWEHAGQWLAAWHQSGPPFGAPADGEEESPGPKSEGPGDTVPSPDGPEKGPEDEEGGDEGPPSDDSEGGPPKGDKDKEKGEKGDLKLDHEIYDLLQKIVVALGIDTGGPEDSPVPGEETPPAPPGPPAGPPGGGPGGPQEIKHERALKPGEAPPGTTPVGAPAFASVEHPWKDLLTVEDGRLKPRVANFFVEERWPTERPVAEFEAEARRVAHGTGFKVKQTTRSTDEDGNPTVKAFISSR